MKTGQIDLVPRMPLIFFWPQVGMPEGSSGFLISSVLNRHLGLEVIQEEVMEIPSRYSSLW